MRQFFRRTPTLLSEAAPASTPSLRGLVKLEKGSLQAAPTFSIRVSDTDLRRIGHLTPAPAGSSQTREEFRMIKRHVLSRIRGNVRPMGRDPRVVLVASSCPGEGKTFVAFNLALSLAIERDLDVTLVDGDITSKDLTYQYDLGSEVGLLDVLDNDSIALSDAVQETNVSNFRILPAGADRPDSTELLWGERMGGVLSELLKGSPNHLVVIDSAALLSGSSAVALASHAGQVVFVVASNKSRRTDIDEGLNVLKSNLGTREDTGIGFVLNNIRPSQSTVRYTEYS